MSRTDFYFFTALLLSISLHMGILLYKPAQIQQSFQVPTGQSMAVTLGKVPELKKEIINNSPEIRDLVTSKANDSTSQIIPKQPEPIVEAQLNDVVGELEELIVTREVQLSQKPISPIYPEKARRDKQEGLVLVRAQVDELGKTHQVVVAQSSGFPLLDNAALAAVAKWSFMPAQQNKHAIMAWIEVPIDFKLR